MTFTERSRVLRSMYAYLHEHPTTATQQDVLDYIHRNYKITMSRKTFMRCLEQLRNVFCVSVIFNNSTKTYITKKL